MLRVVALLLGLFSLSCGPALSETYYVAPLDAVVTGTPDGTEGLPFLSIDTALKSGKVKGGDTLLLKDGAYGDLSIRKNAAFDVPVTIMSLNGKAAQFDRILLTSDTRNLIFRNLSVWPHDPATGTAYLVRSFDTVSDITLDGLDVRSEEGAGDYMNWDAAKWDARKFSGIMLQGPRSLVTRSKLTAIYHGIVVGEDSQIIDNIVDGFNGDGMRAFSRSIVRGNRILNCVKTDGNHDDGFQSFQRNGTSSTTDLVIDSNVFIEWTGAPDHPLRGTLQGIGLFDGPYVNLTIVNNLVAVAHSHGISIYGAKGALVMNNTVVNIRGLSGNVPYIAIRPVRNGGPPSTDVLVVNNVAMSFQGKTSTTDHVEFRDNSVIGVPSLVFENPAAFDYRPKASSGYIDTGDATVAPATDVAGHSRPSGPLPDRGAYEVSVHDAPVDPVAIDPVAVPIERPVKSPTITTITGDKTTTTTTISPGGSKWIMLDKRKVVVETPPPGSIPIRRPLPFLRGKDRN